MILIGIRKIWLVPMLFLLISGTGGADTAITLPYEVMQIAFSETHEGNFDCHKIRDRLSDQGWCAGDGGVWLKPDTFACLFRLNADALEPCTEPGRYICLGWPNIWQWFQLERVSFFYETREGEVLPVSVDKADWFCYALSTDLTHAASLIILIQKAYGESYIPVLAIEDERQIEERQKKDIFLRAGYYGLFLGLMLCAGYGYYSLRDKTFLWYIIQFTVSLLVVTMDRPTDVLALFSPDYCRVLYHLSLSVFYSGSIVFMQYYLDTAVYNPRIHRWFRMLTILCLLYPAAYPFMSMWLRVNLLYVLDVAGLSTLVVSCYVWYTGRVAGKYSVLASSGFVLVYIHFIAVTIFQLPPLIPLNDMMALGNLFEGIVFPLALVMRVRGMVADKQKLDIENIQLQTKEVEARMLAREAELRMLRFQMNPHFLFNALNSLVAEIPDDPKLALHIAMKLSSYLRYTLTSREMVSLNEELQAVKQYLELEELRFEEQLQVSYLLPEKLPEIQVPMFCIQPLVENAVKYGMQTSPDPLQLCITVEPVPKGICVEVANTGKWYDGDSESTGVGLQNVKDRLALYYPGRHEFITAASDGWVRVKLVINGTEINYPSPA